MNNITRYLPSSRPVFTTQPLTEEPTAKPSKKDKRNSLPTPVEQKGKLETQQGFLNLKDLLAKELENANEASFLQPSRARRDSEITVSPPLTPHKPSSRSGSTITASNTNTPSRSPDDASNDDPKLKSLFQSNSQDLAALFASYHKKEEAPIYQNKIERSFTSGDENRLHLRPRSAHAGSSTKQDGPATHPQLKQLRIDEKSYGPFSSSSEESKCEAPISNPLFKIKPIVERHPSNDYLIRRDYQGEVPPAETNKQTKHLLRVTKEVDAIHPSLSLGAEPLQIKKAVNIHRPETVLSILQNKISMQKLAFPSVKQLKSALRFFCREPVEAWLAHSKTQPQEAPLKPALEGLAIQVCKELQNRSDLFEDAFHYLDTVIEALEDTLRHQSEVEQVAGTEEWTTLQFNIRQIQQKNAEFENGGGRQALRELSGLLSRAMEAVQKTLQVVPPPSTDEYTGDWGYILASLRILCKKLKSPIKNSKEKVELLSNFKSDLKEQIRDKALRHFLASLIDLDSVKFLQGFNEKNAYKKLIPILEAVHKDCQTIAEIPRQRHSWLENRAGSLRPIDKLPSSAVFRKLIYYNSISINGTNLSEYLNAISPDDYSKVSGSKIPPSIMEFYIMFLCTIYHAGFSDEFNQICSRDLREKDIKTFVHRQLTRLIEDQTEDGDAPMVQLLQLLSEECWAKCHEYAVAGYPKLFQQRRKGQAGRHKPAASLITLPARENGNSCEILITPSEKPQVTLSRLFEIFPPLPGGAGEHGDIPDRNRPLAQFTMRWEIAPFQDPTGSTYKAFLSISSLPVFTAQANAKQKWKILHAMMHFHTPSEQSAAPTPGVLKSFSDRFI